MDPRVPIFLDHLNTVDINYEATREERTRYHNRYVSSWKDEEKPGKMSIHDDFKKATRSFAKVGHKEGQKHAWTPLKSRIRQKPIDEQLRSQLRWQCGKINKLVVRKHHPLQSRQPGGNPGCQDILTRQVTLQISLPISRFFKLISCKDISECRARDQNLKTITPHRTRMMHHRRIFSRHAHSSSSNAHALPQAQDESHL